MSSTMSGENFKLVDGLHDSEQVAHSAVDPLLPPGLAPHCARCWLGKVCLRSRYSTKDLGHPHVNAVTRRVIHGTVLYRAGEPFHSLFIMRSGAAKSMAVSSSGQEKVTAFHFPGEMFGLPGINAGHYTRDAVVLDDSEVCVIPYAPVSEVALKNPPMQLKLFTVLSCAIKRHQGFLELLEDMTAEERVVMCLLSISARYAKFGYRPERFPVPMTRIDMGSYLGLAHETVTRVLSHLDKIGYIALDERSVELKDVARLREIAGSAPTGSCDCAFFGC